MCENYSVSEIKTEGPRPILVRITLLAVFGGVSQLFAASGSRVINEYGGDPANWAWSFTAILSGVLIWLARKWPGKHEDDAVIIEVAAITLFCSAISWYGIIIVKEHGSLYGVIIPLTILLGSVWNSIDRARMIVSRRRLAGRSANS